MRMQLYAIFIILISYSLCGKMIFEDNFDKLDFKKWQHELTLGGGGNWEFQMYVNNRTNSYCEDGKLFIKPTLSIDTLGIDTLTHGSYNLWGSTPADTCTSNAFYGCERNSAASGNVINPIQSARLRTVNSFSFMYGKVEVRAKMPKGDWIWPAIWLLPTHNEYGTWPASGEIDLVESRGNLPGYPLGGHDAFGSTLHFGPYWGMDVWEKTHGDYKHSASLGDDFHVYGLYWTKDRLYTYIDDPKNIVLDVDMTTTDFWTRGNFPSTMNNPWKGQGKNAPFDREFYIVLNVAVGGTSGYFPDGMGGKPWSNNQQNSVNVFWGAKDQWYSTWKGDESAMQIDYIKVWDFDEEEKLEAKAFMK